MSEGEVRRVHRSYGRLSFAGFRSREDAKLEVYEDGLVVINAAFDVPHHRMNLQQWQARVFPHVGDALFTAYDGSERRFREALVHSHTITGLVVVANT